MNGLGSFHVLYIALVGTNTIHIGIFEISQGREHFRSEDDERTGRTQLRRKYELKYISYVTKERQGFTERLGSDRPAAIW